VGSANKFIENLAVFILHPPFHSERIEDTVSSPSEELNQGAVWVSLD
jgi:hypothetical protein